MIGTQLGPYRLVSEIGSGGMGKVYLAEVVGSEGLGAQGLSSQGLGSGKRIALKMVHPHLLSAPGFFQRFQREVEIGMAVRHLNVVHVYGADESSHAGLSLHFLVMEYVEGQTLRSLLAELGRVPEELCRHIAREVTKGLAAVHGAGAVHRDLKPENLLITADHVVKVMDLGIALLADEAIRLSQTGVFIGSLRYAAPEQLESGGREIDGRADLHALGIVLYELATGRQPFDDQDFRSVVHRVLKENPRPVGELNPQLSPFFEEIVRTLMEKDRERRFRSALELLDALEEGEQAAWWRDRTRAIRLATRRPIRRIRIPRETALCGRDLELSRLHRLYEHARAGDGQVMLIEGEAGIGKTRLADEFVGRLRAEGEDLNFLFGSYPPGGAATAAGAFTTAYLEHFGVGGLADTLKTYLSITPVLIPAFAALLTGDVPPAGAQPLTRDSLQTVFVHATRALAAERPTIVLIDDLHFAPEEGRALFAAIALAAPGHRLLLVATTRPGLPEAWMADIIRLGHGTRLELPRLETKDLTRLLGDALHSDVLAGELVREIEVKSDGNPYFVFEILNDLREKRVLTQRPDGSWTSTHLIEEIQVPTSIGELIRARLAVLEQSADKDLLDMACCAGFEFDPALVAQALELDLVPALKRFARIEQHHRLIRAAGRQYVFDHHQVQEALYGNLFAQLREQYHAALAEAIESRERAADRDPKQLDGRVAVGICEHFLRSGRGERARRYLDSALDHLEAGYLNVAAAGLSERALAVNGLLAGEERIEVLLRRAGRLDVMGRREDERAALDEALALAQANGHPRMLARVKRALGGHLANVSRNDEARDVLMEAIELARAAGDAGGERTAIGRLGTVLHSTGRHEEARAYEEQYLELASEAGDLLGQTIATGNLALALSSLGRLEEALAQQQQCLARAREIGDRRREAIAVGNIGTELLDLGRNDESQAYFERYLALARETGFRQGEALATGNLGNLFNDRGQYSVAGEHYERQLALGREIADRRIETIAIGNLATVSRSLGRLQEAMNGYERHLTLAREIGYRRGEWFAISNLAQALIVLGDPDRARAMLEASQPAFEGTERSVVLQPLGTLEMLSGNAQAAERRYREGIALWREARLRRWLAKPLCALGALLAKQGRNEEAATVLGEAFSLAEELKTPNACVLAAAHLALLPGGDLELALHRFTAYESRMAQEEKMEARFLLWKATGDLSNLQEAHGLLAALRDHAPEEYRETMIENVPLHRDIETAWEAHRLDISPIRSPERSS